MKNAQTIAKQIKKIAKERKVTVKQALIDCNLGPNTVTNLNNGADIMVSTLRKLADYFDCSTDYLLDRNNYNGLSGDIQQLLDYYLQLSEADKDAVLNHAQSLAKLTQFEEAQAVQKDAVS